MDIILYTDGAVAKQKTRQSVEQMQLDVLAYLFWQEYLRKNFKATVYWHSKIVKLRLIKEINSIEKRVKCV